MELEDKKWYQYFKSNAHKIAVWLVFLFVTAILVALSIGIISRLPKGDNTEQKTEEVRIYFQKSVPDSLMNVLKEEVDSVQRTLQLMQHDSIAVSVHKVSK